MAVIVVVVVASVIVVVVVVIIFVVVGVLCYPLSFSVPFPTHFNCYCYHVTLFMCVFTHSHTQYEYPTNSRPCVGGGTGDHI